MEDYDYDYEYTYEDYDYEYTYYETEDYDYDYDYDYTYEEYDYDYEDSNVWDDSEFVGFLINEDVDGYAVLYSDDYMSYFLWDSSGSVCNMAIDLMYTDGPSGVNGFSATNDDGTCLYDDFYSNITMSEDG